MAKMFQVYGIGQALIPSLPPPLPFENAPTSNQTNYEIGQVVFTPPRTPTAFYIYAGGGVWDQFVSSSGAIFSIAGTANQVTVTTTAGATTLSLPAAVIAPGSLEVTSGFTVDAGALTVTTGTSAINISADAAATTINIGTGAGVKAIHLGSSNTSSITTIDAGGGGAFFGTTAVNHTTTVGGTTGASQLILQSGSGGITLSGTLSLGASAPQILFGSGAPGATAPKGSIYTNTTATTTTTRLYVNTDGAATWASFTASA